MIYVGKASSLQSRYRDYIEMVRRLIAVYHGYEVWTDGNGFRYVHYELANAMLQSKSVHFDYFVCEQAISSQALARLEQLEISAAVIDYHTHGRYDYMVLNAMDNIRSAVHSHINDYWRAVQRVV